MKNLRINLRFSSFLDNKDNLKHSKQNKPDSASDTTNTFDDTSKHHNTNSHT